MTHTEKTYHAPPHIDLPDSVDWRTNGAVSPVGNQVLLHTHIYVVQSYILYTRYKYTTGAFT